MKRGSSTQPLTSSREHAMLSSGGQIFLAGRLEVAGSLSPREAGR